MGLTRNLKRIGMAAHNEKRDNRDLIEYQMKMDAKRKEEADCSDEKILMLEMIDKYGDIFTDWYDGPDVPDKGYACDRILLIRAWEAQQKKPTVLDGLTAPVIGYVQDNRVAWATNDTPSTYRAIWDDTPGVARFENQTAPESNGSGGLEAMKKPAEEILSQE